MRHEAKVSIGLCSRCYRPAEIGRLCKIHKRKAKEWAKNHAAKEAATKKARAARLKAAGVCVCGEPVASFATKWCDRCQERQRVYRKKLRRRWLDAGKCICCGCRKAAKDSERCRRCIKKQRERQLLRRLDASRCPSCHEVHVGDCLKCESCRERHRIYMKKLRGTYERN